MGSDGLNGREVVMSEGFEERDVVVPVGPVGAVPLLGVPGVLVAVVIGVVTLPPDTEGTVVMLPPDTEGGVVILPPDTEGSVILLVAVVLPTGRTEEITEPTAEVRTGITPCGSVLVALTGPKVLTGTMVDEVTPVSVAKVPDPVGEAWLAVGDVTPLVVVPTGPEAPV